MVPKTTVAVEDEAKARQLMRLIDALEDNDDVQEVYANFDIDEQVLEAVVVLSSRVGTGSIRGDAYDGRRERSPLR